MRLKFKRFDGRGRHFEPVVDQDTNKEVGWIQSNGAGPHNIGGIEICLFDGKYRITVNRYEECWGFVKGVEAVLNHMVSLKDKSVTASSAA